MKSKKNNTLVYAIIHEFPFAKLSVDISMKILLAHNFYQQPGGEDLTFYREKAFLESKGNIVIEYTVHNDDIKSIFPMNTALFTFWNPKTFKEVSKIIKEQKPDLVHCHNTFPLISPSIFDAARKANIPIIQTLHNYRLICPNATLYRNERICEDCLNKAVPWPGVVHGCYRGSKLGSVVVAGLITSNRIRGMWKRPKLKFIALTDFAKQKMVQGGIPSEKIFVKPNYLTPDPGFTSANGQYALFVGRLSEDKGIDILLEAWKQPSAIVPIKIAGDGPLKDRVIAAQAYTDKLDYIGRKRPEEIMDLYRAAAVLIIPSLWYEGLPQTLVEAYAVGTPVIAPRHGAFPELVIEGKTGFLFKSGNKEDLARCIHTAFTDLSRLEKMRINPRAEFKSNYTAERNYQMLMDIYERALNE